MMRIFASILIFISIAACSKKTPEEASQPSEILPSGESKINVSWTANREADVNTTGGGYRVYISTAPGVNTAAAPSFDVPYTSGMTSPTTYQVTGVAAGTYYIKVIAYSAYNPMGVSGGNRSADSSETSVTVN